MKKIISMLTVSALALGSVFADVSLEFTHKGYIVSDDGKFRYDGYDGTTGCIVFEVSNDNAGVVVDIDPYTHDGIITDANNKNKGKTEIKKGVIFDQYYGWVNVGEGTFKLQSGVWSDGNVNTMDDDGFSWGDDEYAKYDLGVQGGTVAGNITDLTYNPFAGTNTLSTAVTYNVSEDLFVTAAIVGTGSDTYGTNGIAGETHSGFALEAGLSVNEENKLNVIFKNPKKDAIALGVFWENTGLKENLDLLAGLSFSHGNASGNAANTELAFDVRARYELSETVALTTMHNLSYFGTKGNDDDGNKVGIFDIWDMLSVAVKATDTVKVTLTGEWTYTDLRHKDSASSRTSGNGELDFIPGVTYTPADGVDLSTGIIIKTTGWPSSTSTEYAIPLVLHVAL